MIFRFESPYILVLAIIASIYIIKRFFLKRNKNLKSTVRFSDLEVIRNIKPGKMIFWFNKVRYLKVIGIILCIIALGRPQWGKEEQIISTRGIDIMLSLDVSTSMYALDVDENKAGRIDMNSVKTRFQASKDVIKRFIEGRKNDRIGLTVFARRSYTQCPLTLDYSVLLNFLEHCEPGMIEDGTAIGMSIVNNVNRMRHLESPSKVVILLTDGENNAGKIDPKTAAELASKVGVKIYTIGFGSKGYSLYVDDNPIFGKRLNRVRTQIDESLLKHIAEKTGAKYFRAETGEELLKIYEEIDKMEKVDIQIKNYYRYQELFIYFLLPGILLLLLETILVQTRFRKIP